MNLKNYQGDAGSSESLHQRISELEAQLDSKIEIIRNLEGLSRRETQVFELMSDAIIHTRQGYIVFANALALKLHGAAFPEQLIGKKLVDFVHPDDHGSTMARISAHNAGKKLPPIEQKRLRLDGSMFWAEVHASNITSDTKQGRIVILHDLTKRMEAKHALQASEEKFRKTFQSTGIGMSIRNTRDRTLTTNAALCKMIGYSNEEMEASHLADYTHPDDRQVNERLRQQLMDGDIDSYQVTKRLIRKDGKLIWVINDLSVIRDHQGEVHFSINLFQDITETKNTEAQLRHNQKMDSLGTLAGGVAHELNNMLLPIRGLTELSMESVPEGSPVHKNLSVVLNSAVRASALVEKILSFSHPVAAERKLIDLSSVIEEEMRLVCAALPASIKVHLELDESPLMVLADETQIHQVLINLTSNAAHAMSGAVGELTVRLSMFHPQGETNFISRLGLEQVNYAKLSVQDTGCGMDKETVAQIFDPFFTTKEVGEGTGMGLAMMYGIVTSHDGAIDVSSVPGAGTIFDIYLPLAEEL